MRKAALAGALIVAAPATAASFDCGRARTPDERAICASRTLNDRDVVMATYLALNRRLMMMGNRGAMLDRQQAWLAERRLCGADHGCLTRIYDRRIAELRAFLDTRVVPQGPF